MHLTMTRPAAAALAALLAATLTATALPAQAAEETARDQLQAAVAASQEAYRTGVESTVTGLTLNGNTLPTFSVAVAGTDVFSTEGVSATWYDPGSDIPSGLPTLTRRSADGTVEMFYSLGQILTDGELPTKLASAVVAKVTGSGGGNKTLVPVVKPQVASDALWSQYSGLGRLFANPALWAQELLKDEGTDVTVAVEGDGKVFTVRSAQEEVGFNISVDAQGIIMKLSSIEGALDDGIPASIEVDDGGAGVVVPDFDINPTLIYVRAMDYLIADGILNANVTAAVNVAKRMAARGEGVSLALLRKAMKAAGLYTPQSDLKVSAVKGGFRVAAKIDRQSHKDFGPLCVILKPAGKTVKVLPCG